MHENLSSSPEPSRKKGLVLYAVIQVLGEEGQDVPKNSLANYLEESEN